MTQDVGAPLELEDDVEWGPAMRALPNDRWRVAAFAYINGSGGGAHGSKGYKQAIVDAGWRGTDDTLRKTAYRIFNDKRMHAALRELVTSDIMGNAPVARRVMLEIMQTPGHKDQYNAAKTVLALSGVQEAQLHKTEVEHKVSDETIARISNMAKQLGVDPKKMLGWRHAAAVDVEYEEVATKSAAEIEFEKLIGGLK